jgi:hypothetical protein
MSVLMNHRERFLASMGYTTADQVPNWELGVWPQTRERWQSEGLDDTGWTWDWFSGETALGMDPREFISVRTGMMPAFQPEKIAEDAETETFRDSGGRVRTALKAGTVQGGRMSMDTYERFPVETMADWVELKKRYDPHAERSVAQPGHVSRVHLPATAARGGVLQVEWLPVCGD